MPWKIAIMAAATIIGVAGCSKNEPQQPAGVPASTAAEQPTATPSAATPESATAAAPAPATAATPAPATAAAPRPAATAPAAAAAPPAPAPPPAPEPPQPRIATLRAGQTIVVRTTRAVSTKTAKNGDLFSAVLEEPIKSGGWIVAGEGARIDGRIVESDKGGRIKDRATISVELTNLTTADGQKVEIVTTPVMQEAGKNTGKEVAKVGAGAGAGAIVGGIAGGGTGAAIGAVVGGGAGAAMRGEAAEIPAETVLTFELRSPVTIREKNEKR
jgi:hypothetical protein